MTGHLRRAIFIAQLRIVRLAHLAVLLTTRIHSAALTLALCTRMRTAVLIRILCT